MTAATIVNIRTLKNAAILADRPASAGSLAFSRFNLVYGFNGSGKSTLSRIFGSLQKGEVTKQLPTQCAFEIEMDDGTLYKCPDELKGAEHRICVFNSDFIEENLHWAAGLARPVFYIGKEHAQLAGELQRHEASLPAARDQADSAAAVASERERAFGLYKRERAREISGRLGMSSHGYEAPNLAADYEQFKITPSSILTPDGLEVATAISRRYAPPEKLAQVSIGRNDSPSALINAKELAVQTLGSSIIAEFETHPHMIWWVRAGHDYHVSRSLDNCLYCGAVMEAAFDDRLEKFIATIQSESRNVEDLGRVLREMMRTAPVASRVSSDLQSSYEFAHDHLGKVANDFGVIIDRAEKMLLEKRMTPTLAVDDILPGLDEIQKVWETLTSSLAEVNGLIDQHNSRVDDFVRHQEDARLSIRRHYVAEGVVEFESLRKGVEEARNAADSASADLTKKLQDVQTLRLQVRQHGPAASRMNRLIRSYLGHAELTIFPIAEGYELHRHGKLAQGLPSEGEKTAIALCYFLSTLESDGRRIKDLTIVVDDPISSLDTKAMNYACALILGSLKDASQVFVLTHNQHCMNEFKKAWKGLAKPKNPATVPTARLLYLDVKLRAETDLRSAFIVDLPPLLREFDSEYHFLVQKVFEFDKAGTAQTDYGYMMPNVIRRVLDVFLAFRIPRTGAIIDKIRELCESSGIDLVRMAALERLSQAESHSDSLDDLVTTSAPVIEEVHDANATLLTFMEAVDPQHMAALRKYCATSP
jgi:wobble nucleotide-excising tRNase